MRKSGDGETGHEDGRAGAPNKRQLIANLERAAKSRKAKYTPETGTSKPAGADPSDGIQPPDSSAGRGF